MATVLFCSSTTASLAVDGRADVRASRQSGRAGALNYTTESLWENYSLDQRFQLARSTLFQIRYSLQRDNLWSRTGVISSEARKETQVPFMALTYRGRRFRAGLTGNGIRRDTFIPGIDTRRDENLTTTAWARTDIGPAELSGRYLDTQTERSQGVEHNETRNSVLGFVARVAITDDDNIRYSVNHSRNKVITLGVEANYLSNILEYKGSHRFAQDRGRFNLSAIVSRFDQTNTYSIAGTREYISPIWGGLLLDDTPETHDPLEPDPVQESLLHDNDLDTPTVINIGSAASVVREFGGDYRNIILDIGDPTEIDSITLHIDSQLDFPALIRWQVYVTNDPEGRDWGQALTPGVVTVGYKEWELGRQGWEVRFANPLTTRRVKLVNEKLGDTEPNILITEMELFSPPDAAKSKTESALTRYRLTGEVRYDILTNLEVNYRADVYEHRSEGVERNLSGSLHQAGSVWRPADWDVSGYVQTSSLEGTTRFTTDANAQFLSVGRRFNRKINSRISWKRREDNSHTLNYTTHDVNLDFNWRIAPRLTFNQKAGRGMRSDHLSTRDTGSWALISTIRSYPIQTLSVNLKHVDRWVDQDAGSGFTAFSNTELLTQWAILPLVAYENQMIYQRRDKSDWSARHQLAWNPIPGGTAEMSFYVSDFRDTRIDIKQKSVGGHVDWKVRPNTRMEFGAEYVDISQRGEKNRPHNLYIRGSMNF
jgi:hypothetical protein